MVERSKSSLPNLLSAARILLMPTALVVALAGSKPWFVVLLSLALLTDALDGFLARWLHAESDFGRKLDSAADYITLLTGLAGIALLWPDIMRRELPWVASGLMMFFAVIVYGFVRLGRAPCYHTWIAKIAAVACGVSLVPLLMEVSSTPLHLALVLQIIGGFEEIAITYMVPWHKGEVRTIWHAWRLARERRTSSEDGSV